MNFQNRLRSFNNWVKIIDTIISVIAFAVGVVTYLEGEAAMTFDTPWENRAGTISEVTYIIDDTTNNYRITNIGLTILLGNSLFP